MWGIIMFFIIPIKIFVALWIVMFFMIPIKIIIALWIVMQIYQWFF
jgi:hypothetical protein